MTGLWEECFVDPETLQKHFAESFLAEKWEKPAAKRLCSDLALGQVAHAELFAARPQRQPLAVGGAVGNSQHHRLHSVKAVVRDRLFVTSTTGAGYSGHWRLHQPHWIANGSWLVIQRLVFQTSTESP